MKNLLEPFTRFALWVLILFLFLWVLEQSFSSAMNLAIIIGGPLLVYPIIWLFRKLLDQKPTHERAVWITTFVHYTMGILLGIPIIQVIVTHQDWPGGTLPVPTWIGFVLVIITGAISLLTVINLAIKGLGAPFAIALSRRLAVDWMYAWTRNPMVLAALALLVSLGIWYQSALFILWVLVLFGPALLFFVKVYEERELEIRFGPSYLEYKARTPMLLPRRPSA